MALSATCLWASLTDLKPWLSFAATDVAHDAMLEVRANAVTEEIERETGRVFVSRSITQVLDGTGTSVLTLRGYPVTAISAFTLNGTTVPTDDYVLDSEAGLLTRKYATVTTDSAAVWWRGVGNYSITYTAGYARASLPASVLTLGIELLRARYLTWSSNADVYQNVSMVRGASLSPLVDWVSLRKQLDSLRHEFRVGVA
jgi:hypothetical protein